MDITFTSIIAAVAALVTWFITRTVINARNIKVTAGKDAELKNAEKFLELEKKNSESRINLLKEQYEKIIIELKGQQEKAISGLKEQQEKSISDLKNLQEVNLKAVKENIELENEKKLKEREESFKKEAKESFETITKDLKERVTEMNRTFEEQKKSNTEDTASLKTKLDEAVKHLKESTENIGSQADNLAKALRGQNKMQGVFGETILENILEKEGFQKGRDYESECYLRDEHGNIIRNEEIGHKMRPDFILHYPDNTDIIIDAKTSVAALSDWFAAETEEEKADACKRNLASVNSHIEELNSKEYQKFLKGKKTIDYVIMFIPNYGAYQLAKQSDPEIFYKAFQKNVLITTEETLIPFLRLIRSAWIQKDQIENMNEIVSSATKMIERVSLFCTNNAKVKDLLDKTVKAFDDNTRRLESGNQSILKAAKEVEACGVKMKPDKVLPDVM